MKKDHYVSALSYCAMRERVFISPDGKVTRQLRINLEHTDLDNWIIWLCNRSSATNIQMNSSLSDGIHAVYPMKYAHGFVVISLSVFSCFVLSVKPYPTGLYVTGAGAIARLPQCQWRITLKTMGKNQHVPQHRNTTKCKSCAYFLGCRLWVIWVGCQWPQLTVPYLSATMPWYKPLLIYRWWNILEYSKNILPNFNFHWGKDGSGIAA